MSHSRTPDSTRRPIPTLHPAQWSQTDMHSPNNPFVEGQESRQSPRERPPHLPEQQERRGRSQSRRFRRSRSRASNDARQSTTRATGPSNNLADYGYIAEEDEDGDEDAPDPVHWTLKKLIPTQGLSGLYRLGIKLAAKNYLVWTTMMESTLESQGLLEYCLGTVPKPLARDPRLEYWKRANAAVRAILTANMTEEAVRQLGEFRDASRIWYEARRLFSGQTTLDFTLLISKLTTTKFVPDEDVSVHIAQMKEFRSHLRMMNRDLGDDLFAAFLRLSMPPEYNYVFAGLPDRYTTDEVERRIRDDHGVRLTQAHAATAYAAITAPRQSLAAQPKCTNCGASGHVMAGCWSKGGGNEGNGPRQRKPKGRGRPQKDQLSSKNKDTAHEAIVEEESDPSESEVESAYLAVFGATPSSSGRWILDSGTTVHICRDRSAFYTLSTTSGEVVAGVQQDGAGLAIIGRGTIRLTCTVRGRPLRTITLLNVAYCPGARDNLLSEKCMDLKGLRIEKCHGHVNVIKSDGNVVMEGSLRQLYEMHVQIAHPSSAPSEIAFLTQTGSIPLELAHRRLAHLSETNIRYLAKHDMVTGLELQKRGTLGPCIGCAEGKHPQAPFPKGSHATHKLDRLHMDLAGPFETSVHGLRYALTVVDDATRKVFREYLPHKSDATSHIQALITRLETQADYKVKMIRTDGGGEFINQELKTWLVSKGIIHETSAPHTPQQNGVAERANRTIGEHTLALLSEATLTKRFWPEADAYATLVQGMSPSRALRHITPDEAFAGVKPDASTLRVFGSRCHVRVPPDERKKLDPHSLEGIFVGFVENSKAYKVWLPRKHRFVTSRDVIVYEGVFEPLPGTASIEGVQQISSNPSATPVGPEPPTTPVADPPRRSQRVSRPSWIKEASNRQKAQEDELAAERKAVRNARAQRREEAANVAEEVVDDMSQAGTIAAQAYLAGPGADTPANYFEAMRSAQASQWKEGMDKEMEMLMKRKTFVYVNRADVPPDRKIVGNRWTYAKKLGPDGEVNRYKARLVAQGFSQIPGLDYHDTFSPTVRLDSLRILLHMAAYHGWIRGQDDVTGAFLHSKLDEPIYMRQPQGYEDGTDRVLLLKLSLYGLKQSARLWHEDLKTKLEDIGYEQLQTDNAVFVRCSETGNSILAVHVDNVISFADEQREFDLFRSQIHSIFEMTIEDPDWIMGFRLIDDLKAHTVSISHEQYIESILHRFNMEDCNPVSNPLEPGIVLTSKDGPQTPDEITEMKNIPYRELTGALLWISLISRPDIAFTASHLAQFNANPGMAHWNAAKRVLRYLSSTRHVKLVLGRGKTNGTQLIGYTDSDWARDKADSRSCAGYAFLLGDSCVSWCSKKQATVATSSTEAEYMALSFAVKQGLWMRYFLTDIGLDLTDVSTTLHVDNKGAIDLSKEPRFHSRTKHIPIHYHFIREHVAARTFAIVHCSTHDMIADGLTKPLPRAGHENLVSGLGLE